MSKNTMRTGIIRFNLKNRMRQFNGQERHFDIPRLVSAINSPKTQERVKLGDLNGFYGHWSRLTFGAEPQEGGVVNGKVVNLEPCFRTIYLKAFDDGTVEHEAEFFGNEAGLKAFGQASEKSGGFSSVISSTPSGGYEFHGFDYVREPNFSGNRPYTLDSAALAFTPENEILLLDDVSDEINAQNTAQYLTYLQDSLEILTQCNRRLTQENQLLSDSLAHLNGEHQLLMDDVLLLKQQAKQAKNPLRFASVELDNVIANAEQFKQQRLELPEEMQQAQTQSLEQWQVNQVMARYGY